MADDKDYEIRCRHCGCDRLIAITNTRGFCVDCDEEQDLPDGITFEDLGFTFDNY